MAILPFTETVEPLPVPRTPLVGRTGEVAALRAMLIGEQAPLITLTGPGGTGKTRLALAVANEVRDAFTHGVWFVPLAHIFDPSLVLPAVARTFGVPEAGGDGLGERLAHVLGDSHCLIVLDNVEQVIDAAGDLQPLLESCPRMHLLTTSREALRLSSERVFPVPPLSLPASDSPSRDEVLASGAGALFVARARAVRPDFALTDANAEDVLAICRRVDGLPLAIELAASRTQILSPRALLARLTHRLTLLTTGARDAPDRLKTMRNAIAWSHDLLSPGDQALFRRLAVFRGFTLDAADAVCGTAEGTDILDGVTSLAEKSLLQRLPGETERYQLLETIREYATERLDASDDATSVREIHARWFLALAESGRFEFFLPEDRAWLDRMEVEHTNLRAALEWFASSGDEINLARLIAALGGFWYLHSHLREGQEWLERVQRTGDTLPSALRARLLISHAIILTAVGESMAARQLLADALGIAGASGDSLAAAQALITLGALDGMAADYHTGVDHLEQARALVPCLDDPRARQAIESTVRANLGELMRGLGQLAEAQAHYEAALAAKRALGSVQGVMHSTCDLGALALDRGQIPLAREQFREALALASHHLERWATAEALDGLACVAAHLADAGMAARLFGAAETLREQTGVGGWAPVNRPARERGIARARESLGEDDYTAAWEEGRHMTLERAVDLAMNATTRPPTVAAVTGTMLTSRQQEILRLIIDGRSDREIADALSISPRTVMHHVSSICAKLNVPNRTAASSYAIRHRLV